MAGPEFTAPATELIDEVWEPYQRERTAQYIFYHTGSTEVPQWPAGFRLIGKLLLEIEDRDQSTKIVGAAAGKLMQSQLQKIVALESQVVELTAGREEIRLKYENLRQIMVDTANENQDLRGDAAELRETVERLTGELKEAKQCGTS